MSRRRTTPRVVAMTCLTLTFVAGAITAWGSPQEARPGREPNWSAGESHGPPTTSGRLPHTADRVPDPRVGEEELPAGVKLETYAGPFNGAIAMAFTPDGRLLVTEKPGAVRIVEKGVLRESPLLEIPTDQRAERGLLGIAVHPNFRNNGYVYVYHTFNGVTPSVNRIVRFTLTAVAAVDVTPVYTVSESTNIHNGGSLRFGFDGMLYLGVGEGDLPSRATDPTEKRGKILRLDPNYVPLRPAAGNPFADLPLFEPAIWAVGFRNPFGMAFDPIRSRLFSTDNGPDCNDELNLVEPAGDHGWGARYDCAKPDGIKGQTPPVWIWPLTVGITAPHIYSRSTIPGWYGSLLVCSWNQGFLYHAELADDHRSITTMNRVKGVTCNVYLDTGPDGDLYYIEGGGYYPGTIKRIVADRSATPGPRPTSTPRTWKNSPGGALLPRVVKGR